MEKAVEDISSSPLVVIDDTWKIDEIEEKSREYFKNNADGIIVVDYLQLITAENKNKDADRSHIGIIIRRLKLLAKKLNVPIIVLSQIPGRLEKRKDKHPLLSDFKVDDIITFSDVILKKSIAMV